MQPVESKKLQLKICGTKYPDNMSEMAELQPDFLGFIFFPRSPRYMSETLQPADLQTISANIKKVGVFVNASTEEMLQIAKEYNLQVLQLHGTETPQQCAQLQAAGFAVIKVFSLGQQDFDFDQLKPYQSHVDYFLFDTKGKNHGGNGQTFNWKLLEQYKGPVPFFLSGGIGLENLEQIATLNHPHLFALDVNSLFETEPGRKDLQKLWQLQAFIRRWHSETLSNFN